MTERLQSTPRDDDHYDDEAFIRLMTDLIDDGLTAGLMHMALTPGLSVAPGFRADLVLADALRRGLLAVPRPVKTGDTVDGVSRFLTAARSEVQ